MDDEQESASTKDVGGFLGRQHYRLHFNELSETFFARMIVEKCPELDSTAITNISFSLLDLFRRYQPQEIEAKLTGIRFTSANKHTELFADFISAISGIDLEANYETHPALDYYNDHIESRIRWLSSGDERNGVLPCIEGFTKRMEGPLASFDIAVRPAVLVERLARYIENDFELNAKLLHDLMKSQQAPAYPGMRIDYRKQVELLTDYIETRQKTTAEIEFTLLSTEIPFRWALQVLEMGPGLAAPAVATTTTIDKILLPLFLELNGLLDILAMDIESEPTERQHVVVRYFVRRPARRNIFNATSEGLDAAARRVLNETELSVYMRLHKQLRENLAFGGRPKLETSFGTCCSWAIRRAAYCLEEPSFLAIPANEWLIQHSGDKRIQMEDQFFLPHIYERLRNEFGSRVVKKPERFAGEIDILFDDVIPIELKVRRGSKEPLDLSKIDDSFRPGSQAAAYASISRVGIVLILDLSDLGDSILNLESCATVIEKRFPEDSAYPTSIVIVTFRCQHPKPSAIR